MKSISCFSIKPSSSTSPSPESSATALLAKKSPLRSLVLAYKTLGIVYGGLATSPLYLFPSIIMPEDPAEGDFLGVLSIVFWTLTLIGILKYSFIVIHADDNGEGGSFALYSLITQRLNSRKASEEHVGTCKVTKMIQGSRIARRSLFLVAMLGSLMLFGDAVLTPAISVLSAIDGLKNVSPSITQNVVALVSAAILVALFMMQRFGTHKVSLLFSPIMLLWMITNTVIGGINIASYYPGILKAVIPTHAVSYFLNRGRPAFISLTGTALSISGIEAMYADLGHFDRRSMQIAFLVGVYPSCMVTYAGQAAYFIHKPEDCNSHAYYNSIPKVCLWPMFVVATVAAIVASQSLISGCFSLVKQSVELDQFPRVRLIHTSKSSEGQIYSPEINYALMALCVAVVLGFREGSALGNAYGVTVIMVLVVTTFLFTVAVPVVFSKSVALALTFLVVFGIIEGVYLSAVLTSVPSGGWLPFLIAVLAGALMFSWIYGRQKKRQYEAANKVGIDDFGGMVSSLDVKRVSGLCIFYTSTLDSVPPFVTHYLKHARSMHRVVILACVKPVSEHFIPEEDRFDFRQMSLHNPGVYLCTARYGFTQANEILRWDNFSDELVKSLEEHVRSVVAAEDGAVDMDELVEIEAARRHTRAITVFIGRTQLVSKEGSGIIHFLKKLAINKIYRFLHTNCPSATPFLSKPRSGLVEIGMTLEV